MKDVMTVGNLIAALMELPPYMPIGFSVSGHSWYGPCHRGSHGAVNITKTRLHFASAPPVDIALIHQGEIRTESDGYRPTPIA